MSPGWKKRAETFLVRCGAAAVFRRRLRRRALILAYHNIVPAGTRFLGDRSLHVELDRFEDQLDLLRQTHRVVSLDGLLEPAVSENIRPRVAITFDDAYHGALTLGVRALIERGMPATFFVAPGVVGGRALWWDVIGEAHAGELPASVRTRGLGELRGEGERILAWAKGAGIPCEENAVPMVARTASRGILRAAGARPGIQLASHSWGHPNLTRLSREELRAEVERPLEWLRGITSPTEWIAYPYGLSDEAAREAARAAGYRAAVLIRGGWMSTHPSDPYSLPRFNVPSGLSRDGLALRLAGILCDSPAPGAE